MYICQFIYRVKQTTTLLWRQLYTYMTLRRSSVWNADRLQYGRKFNSLWVNSSPSLHSRWNSAHGIRHYETTIIESAHKTVNVKRKTAFSDLGQELLLNEVNLREKRMFGKCKGSGRGKKEREEEMEEVARALNKYDSLLFFFKIRFSIIISHKM